MAVLADGRRRCWGELRVKNIFFHAINRQLMYFHICTVGGFLAMLWADFPLVFGQFPAEEIVIFHQHIKSNK
jgi:hypothetical protein